MLEFDWNTFIMYFILEPLVFLFFFSFTIGYLKQNRKSSYILVDIDTLIDIKPVVEQGKIWAENTGKSFEEYFLAHITEQAPNPRGLVRAIFYQHQGYSLAFIGARTENTRLVTAKFLNDWNLKGELFLFDNKSDMLNLLENGATYRQYFYDRISLDKNIAGIIDGDTGLRGVCEVKNKKCKRGNK